MPSFFEPSGWGPKPEITLPRAGQRKLPAETAGAGVASVVASRLGAPRAGSDAAFPSGPMMRGVTCTTRGGDAGAAGVPTAGPGRAGTASTLPAQTLPESV